MEGEEEKKKKRKEKERKKKGKGKEEETQLREAHHAKGNGAESGSVAGMFYSPLAFEN